MDTEQATQLEQETNTEVPIVDAAYKSTFSTFLKSILGKDVDSVRIPVPLWLIEPISNLEYLGSLEHVVEHFVSASLKQTPLERMVCIVTMLLSSLNKATRRVKKPLNPILGEIFYSWFTPQENRSLPSVFLVGEQISHHPPLSAFYATCPTTGINVTLLFDLKAKFNGMSFSLLNGSHATVNIPLFQEEYIITYPNANLVGVLSMAFRLMWTGKCTITCEKSRLQAIIEFKEKRWFGRDTYEMTGMIKTLDVSENDEVFAHLSGQWNGKMYIKYTDHPKQDPPHLLLDSSMDPPYMIHVPDHSLLPPNASTSVWYKVIGAMHQGNSQLATQLKNEIEANQRRQRDSLKQSTYIPKYFTFEQPHDSEEVEVVQPRSRIIKYIGGDLPDRDETIQKFLA